VHGVFGTSAITAITAQNTRGVTAVEALSPSIVAAQIEAVLSDIGADAIKIGMLATRGIAVAVAHALLAHPHIPVVLDPVMVAKGGARLLDDDTVAILRQDLIPLSTVVTANAPEAEALTGFRMSTPDDLARAASAIVRLGARAALVKGGHLAGGAAIDVLVDGTKTVRLEAPRHETRHTHGTGCTLAAAIAANLAMGADLETAARRAKQYVTWAITHAPGIGHGHGPLGWGREGLGLH
jgi:hydroxymethylpyrimidine/phosphomethylpyrimidine kinase